MVRIPHICVLLVCAFFTTPPPCVCQHNLWHCHVTVCATIMSQTKVFGRDPTPSYIVVGLPSDSRRAKSHFVHCPLKIDLSLRRVRNILAPGRAHELGTAGQAGYCGCERAKSLLWAIFGPLAVFSAILPPRMRSIRVPLVTVLSGPVCPRGFRKAQMLLPYERCLCLCVCM